MGICMYIIFLTHERVISANLVYGNVVVATDMPRSRHPAGTKSCGFPTSFVVIVCGRICCIDMCPDVPAEDMCKANCLRVAAHTHVQTCTHCLRVAAHAHGLRVAAHTCSVYTWHVRRARASIGRHARHTQSDMSVKIVSKTWQVIVHDFVLQRCRRVVEISHRPPASSLHAGLS